MDAPRQMIDVLREIRDSLHRIEASLGSDARPAKVWPSTEQIAATVRGECAKRGVTNRDLEAILQRSRPTVAARYNGVYPFTSSELDQLANAWGVSVAWILDQASREGRSPAVSPLPARDIFAQPPRAVAASLRQQRR